MMLNETPFPNVTTARTYLRTLVEKPVDADELNQLRQLPLEPLIAWIKSVGLGPLTNHRYRTIWPALSQSLMIDMFDAMGSK